MLLETDPNAFYQAARAKFDADEAFADPGPGTRGPPSGRRRETLRLWGELVELSKHYFNRIYSRSASP